MLPQLLSSSKEVDMSMEQEHPMRMGSPGDPNPRHDQEALVGTCSAMDCEYNDDSHCHAANIAVIKHQMHADCGTYEPRR
jgi:hypothetical protein